MAKKYVSTTLERQVASYLKTRIYRMFIVDMFLHYRGKSEHGTYIITKYYESLTDNQQNLLLAEYDNVKAKYEPKKGAPKRI